MSNLMKLMDDAANASREEFWRPIDVTSESMALKAALAALDEAGYVIVPKCPTYEMVIEGLHPAIPGSVSEIYKEMIKARPDVVLKAPKKWDDEATLVLK
jgi:hypothetical protein